MCKFDYVAKFVGKVTMIFVDGGNNLIAWVCKLLLKLVTKFGLNGIIYIFVF